MTFSHSIQERSERITRADGIAKVTGAAEYAADWPIEHDYAVLVTSTISAGYITEMDVVEAEQMPGVVAIFTWHNAPRLHPIHEMSYAQRLLPLQDNVMHYEGEPIAVVVGKTLETAQDAASRIQVTYDAEPAHIILDQVESMAYQPSPPARWGPADTSTGDITSGIAQATTILRQRYTTASRHHCPMEPSATLAQWDGTHLTIYDASQGVFNVQAVVAAALGLEITQVRVFAKYTGGGFGCKGYIWPHEIIAAMVAHTLGRAILLTLTRAQTFTSHGYQAPTVQDITLAATQDGYLTAIRHTVLNATSTYATHVEMAANCSRVTYACPAIETRHRVAPISTILPTLMRAPHEGQGMFALESAMDELANELAIDPLELRLRNYAETNPTTGEPFSSKKLRECYVEGARRFGWERRSQAPRSMRVNGQLIGWGMASATMPSLRFPASARIHVAADGAVVIETGCQEIGTGTYTIMPQIAAEVLGCSPRQVTLRLGDTTLPRTWMTAGSSTTVSVGAAVHAAACNAISQLAKLALGEDASADAVSLMGSHLLIKEHDGKSIPLATLFASHGRDGIWADGDWTPSNQGYAIHSFGAVFAEVLVNESLGLVRVSRLVGIYSAGRIINPLTARSQAIGGMVWGIGQALLEQSHHDPVRGSFLSKNLAGYLVPVHADTPVMDIGFIEEQDTHAGPVGARGIGELCAVGVSAAISNAVYHATGKHVRHLPITLDSICSHLDNVHTVS